jgi:hypothetical protein
MINSFLVYTSENNNAKNPIYKTASLSSSPTTMLDIELVNIFQQSVKENTPYLVELGDVSWEGWIKRQRKYWEEEKGVSITYHALTKSIWIVPMR